MLPNLEEWIAARKSFKFVAPELSPELKVVVDEITKTNKCIVSGSNLLFPMFGRSFNGNLRLTIPCTEEENKKDLIRRLRAVHQHRYFQICGALDIDGDERVVPSLFNGHLYIEYLFTRFPKEVDWGSSFMTRLQASKYKNPVCQETYLLNVAVEFVKTHDLDELLNARIIASDKLHLILPENKLHVHKDFVKFLVAGDATIGLTTRLVNSAHDDQDGPDEDDEFADADDVNAFYEAYIHPIVGDVRHMVSETNDLIYFCLAPLGAQRRGEEILCCVGKPRLANRTIVEGVYLTNNEAVD